MLIATSTFNNNLTIRQVDMPPGVVLFNQLLTPHWVQSPLDTVAFSINLSHGGLRRTGTNRQLCRNEVTPCTLGLPLSFTLVPL